MIYLSCVKYNSIPYSHNILPTTTYGTIQRPKLVIEDISFKVMTRYATQVPVPELDSSMPHRSRVRSWCLLHLASR